MTDRSTPDADPTPAPAASPPPPSGRWSRRVFGPFSLGHIVALVGTLAGVMALLLLLTTPISSPVATDAPRPGASFYVIGERTEGLAIGQIAPELVGDEDGQAIALVDLDGMPVRLADLRGQPVWVNFWASWCPPCQQETPVLRAMDERYREDGLAIVAVSVQEASPEDVRRYVETYGLGFRVGFDATSAVFRAWRGYGLPTHYLIDPEGVIQAVHYGPVNERSAEILLATIMPPAPTGTPEATDTPPLGPPGGTDASPTSTPVAPATSPPGPSAVPAATPSHGPGG